jgi:adenylate cyclase
MWQKYREHTPEILIGLLFSVVLIVALASPPNPIAHVLERAEMALYDLRLRLGEGFAPKTQEPPIVIIDIDELSQKQEGRWPWPRERVVTLIERLGEKQPAVIVLDVLFGVTEPEPQEDNPTQQCSADYCPITSRATAEDRQLAAAFAKYDVVSGFLFHSGRFVTGELPSNAKPQPDNLLSFPEATGYATNTPILQQASKAEGFINTYLATDGTARRLPLFKAYDDFLYPSLALATVQRFLLENDWQAHTARIGSTNFYSGISVGNKTIPTDQTGSILIPFNTGKAPFTVISATDIMRNTGNVADSLEGAIVIIGASAILLGDLKTTPIHAEVPGTFLHAYAISGLLNPETLLHEPAWGLTAELLLLLGLTLVLLFIYPQCGPRQLLICGGLMMLLITVANVWVWREQQIRLDLLPSLVLIMLLTGLFVIYDLLRENRTRHNLQYLFGQYVPPEHISRILAQPNDTTFAGEKREMSVLFADLHEFTSIAERLDTQTLKHLLNSYLNAATEVIFHHSGTIDKYIGDMVMAFWNAPLREPHHARQAVLCAMGLRKMLTDKADEFRQFGITPLQLGIGINTGDMNVGDMGSDHRRAYTVLGDAVNLAARIESLTRFYAVDILVSEHTAAQCQGITFRTIDRVRVKGKRETVLLYHPLGLTAELSPALQRLHDLHERAMRCYWCRDWEHASKLFARILIESPDEHIAGMFLQRIAALIPQSLPDSWDGVYEHRQK